ncbi:MAG TPA: GIY-YIG nuclease family protein [Longimicrobium sp.]|nr:GIY-YIG nuclease family protein [Longimicrobium sp.]
MHSYYVYILASIGKTLYIGVTNDLPHRVQQHKTGMIPGFTSKYKVNRLVYFETFADVYPRAREKQLKGWVRRRKIALIEVDNPEWEDLADRIGAAVRNSVRERMICRCGRAGVKGRRGPSVAPGIRQAAEA